LKKRTKKLLLALVRTRVAAALTNGTKVFWCFFSKKNCFLPFLLRAHAYGVSLNRVPQALPLLQLGAPADEGQGEGWGH
jgi:hypothetical protein